MPFARPPLTTLRNQAIQDITTSGVPGLDGLLRNAVLRVLAWVMSGLAYSVYGYLDWIAREAVPFTATDEFLEAWAALIGINRKDSTAATGAATFLGAAGLVIPAGTGLTRQDGTPYTTTADGTVSPTGSVTVPIVAAVNGAATNCLAGTAIAIDTGIPGINSSGSVAAPGCTGGADQETEDDLRTRMLAKYRDPPQGGATADYIEWATELPGCTRAWALPNGWGPGTVVVYPMFDDTNAATDGFPVGTDGCATEEPRAVTATGDQLAVADHIWPKQPVTALVYVAAPSPHPIDISLYQLDPNTADMRAAISVAIEDLYLVIGEPGGTIYPSDIYEAILSTPGIVHFTVAAPATSITLPMGSLPVMGDLTVASRDAG